MLSLTVPYSHLSYNASIDEVRKALSFLPPVPITALSWDAFPYRPEVSFKIAHTRDSILLQYDVNEEHIRAVYRNTNDPVYKDSCVEFFISFDGSNYYNLEFNCLGTGLTGYGPSDKLQRIRLPDYLIEKVKTDTLINPRGHDGIPTYWQLILNIPFEIFYNEYLTSLSGVSCRANFYKCGDELPVPHYVSWNRIETSSPDFHRPEFFGTLHFE